MIYTANLEEKLYIPDYISIHQLRSFEREWIMSHPDYTPKQLKDAIKEAFPPQE